MTAQRNVFWKLSTTLDPLWSSSRAWAKLSPVDGASHELREHVVSGIRDGLYVDNRSR